MGGGHSVGPQGLALHLCACGFVASCFLLACSWLQGVVSLCCAAGGRAGAGAGHWEHWAVARSPSYVAATNLLTLSL